MYDAEMAGLMMGTKLGAKFTTRHPKIKRIVFFVDNAAVARAIFNPKPKPGQLYAASEKPDVHRMRNVRRAR